MPVSAGRRSAVIVTVLAVSLVLALLPAAVAAKEPPGLNRFAEAVGAVESGGRYNARNTKSGAIGKYQILPAMWRAWAKLYLGDANAKPTPANQERLARAKFIALWNWLDSWPAVAHWWLTGNGERNPAKWSPFSAKYVAKVMKRMGTASDEGPVLAEVPAPAPVPAPATVPAPVNVSYQDASAAIAYAGTWSKAHYHRYAGGTVRYATARGATATLSFSGRSVTWIGPAGPTRGSARVYLDGKLVRTVDLKAGGFTARRTIFSMSWSTAGAHTLRIEVLGTAGHPLVAIDEIRVTG